MRSIYDAPPVCDGARGDFVGGLDADTWQQRELACELNGRVEKAFPKGAFLLI
jgi:hypothetical protein